MPNRPAISSGVGSRPITCRRFRQVRTILFNVSRVATEKLPAIIMPHPCRKYDLTRVDRQAWGNSHRALFTGYLRLRDRPGLHNFSGVEFAKSWGVKCGVERGEWGALWSVLSGGSVVVLVPRKRSGQKFSRRSQKKEDPSRGCWLESEVLASLHGNRCNHRNYVPHSEDQRIGISFFVTDVAGWAHTYCICCLAERRLEHMTGR
jgi:hypothetical protein